MNKKAFKPNRAFKRKYNFLFKKDQLSANLFLLLAEMADREGHVIIPNPPEETLLKLLNERFTDPRGYQL